jgi:hypothetical protein
MQFWSQTEEYKTHVKTGGISTVQHAIKLVHSNYYRVGFPLVPQPSEHDITQAPKQVTTEYSLLFTKRQAVKAYRGVEV